MFEQCFIDSQVEDGFANSKLDKSRQNVDVSLTFLWAFPNLAGNLI